MLVLRIRWPVLARLLGGPSPPELDLAAWDRFPLLEFFNRLSVLSAFRAPVKLPGSVSFSPRPVPFISLAKFFHRLPLS